MERHFILDKYNTWSDWCLILTAKDVTPPAPKTNYVALDGMSGTLDLSEALGGVVYEDRKVTASFWTNEGTMKDRVKLLKDIALALHGKKVKIIEPDDPEHYFLGRITIKSTKNIIPYAEIEIEATCEPWRYAINETTRRIDVNKTSVTEVVVRNNGAKTLLPIIKVTGSVSITYDGNVVTLNEGEYRISEIKLYHGVNIIGVAGYGSVTFVYREGDL